MHIIYIHTCVYAWIFIGYKFVSRADFGVISVHSLFHFKIKMTIQKKTMTTSFHSSVMWSPPYKTALFLGISGKIYTFFSAKESFDRPLEETMATCPSQEIRSIRADLFFANGEFFVSFDPEKTKHMTYISPINHLYNL